MENHVCFHCEQKIDDKNITKSGGVYFHQRCFEYCEETYAEIRRKEESEWKKD